MFADFIFSPFLKINLAQAHMRHVPVKPCRFVTFFFLNLFRYREVDDSHELIRWFWETLESFSNDERILFMRFVSGRSRLPANPADISQRFQIMKVDRVSYIITNTPSKMKV